MTASRVDDNAEMIRFLHAMRWDPDHPLACVGNFSDSECDFLDDMYDLFRNSLTRGRPIHGYPRLTPPQAAWLRVIHKRAMQDAKLAEHADWAALDIARKRRAILRDGATGVFVEGVQHANR